MELERRTCGDIRAAGRTLVGLAAPFGRAADIGGLFTEIILPGAFRATLAAGSDIPALADHNPAALLARRKSGNLRLAETTAGLMFEIDLPPTTLGNDLAALAARGDLGGMSFAFVATDQAWPDPHTRQLRSVELHEISVITGGQPAFDGTSVALRARERAAGAYLRRARLLEMTAWH
jgi:HK97 family phage prohead protease